MPNADMFEATNEEYHSMFGVSSSMLRSFDEDPLRYKKEQIDALPEWQRRPTPSMQFGSNVHEMLERGGDWRSMTQVVPDHVLSPSGHRRGKKYDEWKNQQTAPVLLKADEINPYREIMANLKAHQDAYKLFCGEGDNEINIKWDDAETGLQCRVRLDRYSKEFFAIVDWKTATRIDARGFQAEIEARRYHQQMAFYREGWYQLTGDQIVNCCLIAIKNSPGYAIEAYRLDDTWLDRGWSEMQDIMLRYVDAVEKDEWQPLNYGTLLDLQEPGWAKYQDKFELDEDDDDDAIDYVA